jgi:hypothetical protein
MWWATKNGWLGLLDVSGLELEALYGGFGQEPFHDDSREYVFVARRLASGLPRHRPATAGHWPVAQAASRGQGWRG